ncbi:UdgX family uracil-DNA binding protein [Roseibacillus persicicus]|uniref:UdgX family uracil-DNA binding protein n=1 Tax=Roseibacillus persicicus TaxID=454148 RepID=UPI00398AAA33
MQTITISPTLASWREAARELLLKGISPAEILFEDGSQSPSLFLTDDVKATPAPTAKGEELSHYDPRSLPQLNIPKSFLDLAEMVACNRDPERWSLLYQAVHRITLGRERQLLRVSTDPLTRRLTELSKAVSRDRHKMKAFVRFRKIGELEENGREQFVAWFEPEHFIVELTAPFFAKRFASFDWSILTPERCAHWDGDRLEFTQGVEASQAPQDDELEDYWRTYYASIFNPARLKLKAMQSEMPKKYWKNLPEAPLIADLTSSASQRAMKMVEDGPNTTREHVSAKVPTGAQHPDTDELGLAPEEALAKVAELSMAQLDAEATACRYCPLYEAATQTVFGEGPPSARVMLIGEQPGDQEDIAGRPFVGPAGQLLDRALLQAGLKREDLYLTNTVKHFKFKSQGRRRLHERANAEEIHRCKPWVLAEILKVQPEVIVLLGSTAAQALIDPSFQILKQRGLVKELTPLAPTVVATVHPSYLLRLKGKTQTEEEMARFVADLKLATKSRS